MDTFKQYYKRIITEMGDTPTLVARDAQDRIRNAHDVARQARRGRAQQEDINAAMEDMVATHKSLNQYSSHELKDKIVDKYNELKNILQGENTGEYTVQHLEDCVQYLQVVCDDLLAG